MSVSNASEQKIMVADSLFGWTQIQLAEFMSTDAVKSASVTPPWMSMGGMLAAPSLFGLTKKKFQLCIIDRNPTAQQYVLKGEKYWPWIYRRLYGLPCEFDRYTCKLCTCRAGRKYYASRPECYIQTKASFRLRNSQCFSEGGQWRLKPDCACAQLGLCLRRPRMTGKQVSFLLARPW